jgi:hypothetical protein
MAHPPVFIEKGQISSEQKRDSLEKVDGHPALEDHLGGGDICSPEEQPSTDDDMPLN